LITGPSSIHRASLTVVSKVRRDVAVSGLATRNGVRSMKGFVVLADADGMGARAEAGGADAELTGMAIDVAWGGVGWAAHDTKTSELSEVITVRELIERSLIQAENTCSVSKFSPVSSMKCLLGKGRLYDRIAFHNSHRAREFEQPGHGMRRPS
jgi:hypothetical protein